MEAKREDLQPGEFRARVRSVDDVTEQSTAALWSHCIGYRDAKHAAERVAIENGGLAFEDSVARVEVEDHTGAVRTFDVRLKIKAWGEVTEVPAS
jgi:hypothetical protein